MKQPFKWRFFTSQSRLRLFSDFSFCSIFGRGRFRHSWWLIVFWRCTAHLVLIWRQVISKHCYNKDFTQLTLLKNMTWLCSAHGFSFAAPASYATVKQFGQADVIFNWASILILTPHNCKNTKKVFNLHFDAKNSKLIARPFRFRQKYETFWMTFWLCVPCKRSVAKRQRDFPLDGYVLLLFTKMRKYRKEHLRLLEKMTHFDLRLHLF